MSSIATVTAGRSYGDRVRKVFLMDSAALAMELELWEPILRALSDKCPNPRRVSCYATALNLLAKSHQELERLRDMRLKLLYIGPESGDDVTLRRIAKGASSANHVKGGTQAYYTYNQHLSPDGHEVVAAHVARVLAGERETK